MVIVHSPFKTQDMLLIVTANSDKEHFPIRMEFIVSGELADRLMSQRVTTVSLAISFPRGMVNPESPERR